MTKGFWILRIQFRLIRLHRFDWSIPADKDCRKWLWDVFQNLKNKKSLASMSTVRPKSTLMILINLSRFTIPLLSGFPPHETKASTAYKCENWKCSKLKTNNEKILNREVKLFLHISLSSSNCAARCFWFSITFKNSLKSLERKKILTDYGLG